MLLLADQGVSDLCSQTSSLHSKSGLVLACHSLIVCQAGDSEGPLRCMKFGVTAARRLSKLQLVKLPVGLLKCSI